MNLDELASKLPAEWKPIVNQYGPAFLTMTSEEVWAWLAMAVKGDAYAAHAAALAKLPNADLLAAWNSIGADWTTANAANAAKIAWQRDAAYAVLKVLVAIAAVAVGL